jgi:hypothetical protein
MPVILNECLPIERYRMTSTRNLFRKVDCQLLSYFLVWPAFKFRFGCLMERVTHRSVASFSSVCRVCAHQKVLVQYRALVKHALKLRC